MAKNTPTHYTIYVDGDLVAALETTLRAEVLRRFTAICDEHPTRTISLYRDNRKTAVLVSSPNGLSQRGNI